MNRRVFIRRSLSLTAAGFGCATIPSPVRPAPRQTLQLPATLQAQAFASSSGDDGRYHALVYREGGAAPKALLTTPISDREIARALRRAGARDGGGVPMAAWNLRRVPLIGAPNSRVSGSPLRILVEWDEWGSPRDLSSLVEDPGRQGVSFRFGGNEEHDHLWESGCVACFFSCPGGVVSNERYTIRDYVSGGTRFSPAPDLPRREVPVTVTIELLA